MTRSDGFNLFLLLLALTAPTQGWPEEEAVKGYYDSTKDWFVFEWTRPETGKEQRIYDSSNKIKPSITASVSLDKSTGVFSFSYKIANGSNSVQSLADIHIGFESKILEALVPDPHKWYSAETEGKNLWHWARIKHNANGIPAGESVS